MSEFAEPLLSAQLGLGRDLFAFGLVVLETALMTKGQESKNNDIFNSLTFPHESPGKAQYRMQRGDYKNGVEFLKAETFEPNSIEAFARSCIIKSIELEESRLANKNFGFERYSPDNDRHLLAELERELALVR